MRREQFVKRIVVIFHSAEVGYILSRKLFLCEGNKTIPSSSNSNAARSFLTYIV